MTRPLHRPHSPGDPPASARPGRSTARRRSLGRTAPPKDQPTANPDALVAPEWMDPCLVADLLARKLTPDSLARVAEAIRFARTRESNPARLEARIEWILGLPWPAVPAEAGFDSKALRRSLDRDLCGLDLAKQRSLDALAAAARSGEREAFHGTVLGFFGPPGTGKSALADSLARATGRRLVRVSMASIEQARDWTGQDLPAYEAQPGALLEALQASGGEPCVVLLDGLDELQLGAETEAASLLSPLFEPDGLREHIDRYLGVPFDLSSLLVLVTARDAEELSETLVDRLQRVDFSGYSEREKLLIAKRGLLPRARRASSLTAKQVSITDGALLSLVQDYTEESGVHQLERNLRTLTQRAAMARRVGTRAGEPQRFRKADLAETLGAPIREEELRLARPTIGHVQGLAWTSGGGALLPIEALATKGSGRTTLTGQVGEVMRESFQTACSFVRTRLASLGLPEDAFDQLDLHLHLPAAAIPKDGPSAGLPLAVAVYSLASGLRVRHDVAMTGEISLYGRVLPVGGLREKLLAAQRAGLRAVLVPLGNREELLTLPPDVRDAIRVELISTVDQALDFVLDRAGHRVGHARIRRSAFPRAARQHPAPAVESSPSAAERKRQPKPSRRQRDADSTA